MKKTWPVKKDEKKKKKKENSPCDRERENSVQKSIVASGRQCFWKSEERK